MVRVNLKNRDADGDASAFSCDWGRDWVSFGLAWRAAARRNGNRLFDGNLHLFGVLGDVSHALFEHRVRWPWEMTRSATSGPSFPLDFRRIGCTRRVISGFSKLKIPRGGWA